MSRRKNSCPYNNKNCESWLPNGDSMCLRCYREYDKKRQKELVKA